MKNIIFLYLIFNTLFVFSQKEETEKITAEGKLLYRLERGSWYGTDDMLVRFTKKRDSIGGYLSYETPEHSVNTIFFSISDPYDVLIRYHFDSLPQPLAIRIDTLNHRVSELERDLITIRQDALGKVTDNHDDFFKFYENSAFNFIPLIRDNEKRVFILTGPQVSEVIIIGNDYKLNYDLNNQFVSKEKIHNSLLQFSYKSENVDNPTVTTFHSHILSKYITSTDICTLLLYKDFVEWRQHIVMSNEEVSIFDLDKELLVSMKRKAWDNLNAKKQKPK